MTTRTVEGGFINADCYPTHGEPDWKADALRLRVAMAEIVNSIAGVRGAPAQRVRRLIKQALDER